MLSEKYLKTRLVYFLQEKKNHLIIKTDYFFMEMIVATNAHLLMPLLLMCPEQAHLLLCHESVGLKCFSNAVQFFLYETFW